MADVAVACLRLVGNDTEGDHRPLLSQRVAIRRRLAEAVLIADTVIGRHYQKHRVMPVTACLQGRKLERGCRIASLWLQDDGGGLPVQDAELLGYQKAVGLVADHNGVAQTNGLAGMLLLNPVQPSHGLLEHGVLACQRQKLLWVGLPGQRPQTGSGSAGKNHGL